MRVDYPPLQAQALETLGRLQIRSASAREAELTLREAIKMTSVAGDPNLEARAWSSLIFTLVPQGKVDLSEELNFAAEAAVARSDDPMARAWLLNSQGVLLAESGRLTEAHQKTMSTWGSAP